MQHETTTATLSLERVDISTFQVAFETRTGSTEKGPLAALWRLIESYEVDIFVVSLSRITADFLTYMQSSAISLDEQADFTQMAARLIYYKSRQLLPNAAAAEDTAPDTLPYELVEQLLEYKKMQQAAEQMRTLEEKSQLRFARDSQWNHFEKDLDYLQVDLLSFLKAFRDFLEREEKSRPMQIADEHISVEEMIPYMASRIVGESEASFFRSVTGFSIARIVACFLALLEMAKQGLVALRQDVWLGDIHFIHATDGAQLSLAFENTEETAPRETAPYEQSSNLTP
ncbi:MAG TPA: segregation/condensation protein A [Turneriella sp.]|nr:segregation/condensation protein A [Turneriella sp.]